jgi:iron complex outermembrane receptor protein
MSKPIPAPKALAVALAGVAAVSVSAVVLAQEAPVERIEITGSAIRRIEAETALPVTTLTREDIAKTGATSATDLLQMLPALQGYLTASDSVNGGGGGVTTAALHSLPSKYTLVLIDGQRVATTQLNNSFGGGFATNIESIPLDAVERVEILSDGASALYGADAVAGVVNFILRKNSTAGATYFNWTGAQHPGGDSWTVGFSKGFGDLNTNHFNVFFDYTHDQQSTVNASERSFSKRGAFFPFTINGKQYIFNNATSNTEPANIVFKAFPTATGPGPLTNGSYPNVRTYSINPYYEANGNCGSPLANVLTSAAGQLGSSIGESCRFNYAATVEDVPPSKRDAGLIKGTLKLDDNTTGFAEFLISNFTITPRYAPPAQPLGLGTRASKYPILYNGYVAPYLAANGLTNAAPLLAALTPVGHTSTLATLGYRAIAAGGRTDDYTTETEHFTAGLNGSNFGFDWRGTVTRSHMQLTDNLVGGYADSAQFSTLVNTGVYDPVADTGVSNLKSTVLHDAYFQQITSDLTQYTASAQRTVLDLPGGASIIAFGAEYDTNHYTVNYSPFGLVFSGFDPVQGSYSDFPIGGNYGQVPVDASRNNWGAFTEWDFPVIKQFEVDLSGRYDYYGKVASKYVFSDVSTLNAAGDQFQLGNAQVGNTSSAGTAKVTMRIQPIEQLLIRGSWGMGFRAPALTDLAGALVFNGSTAGSYNCPANINPALSSAGCLAGSAQYDLVAGPNSASGAKGLKNEDSRQWTIGVRGEPVPEVSLGADLWNVRLTNQIRSQGIDESVAFTGRGPFTYQNLFIDPYADPAGFTTIAFQQLPFNGPFAEYRGVDWDASVKARTPIGNLAAQWTGTYMLRQEYTFVEGGPLLSDLGQYGPDQLVVFRIQSNALLSLQTGKWANSLTAHYKSGYQDAPHSGDGTVFPAANGAIVGGAVNLCPPSGTAGIACLHVSSYTTFDWQTVFDYSKSMHVTLGIKNLFDRDPPFTLQDGGGGNQIGYDGRYADPIGRQFYIIGKYTF